MRSRIIAYAFLVALLPATGAQAANPYRGMLLYDNYCLVCHYPYLHLRPRSKVHSFDELGRQVDIWQRALGLGWSGREIVDVQAYLNWLYYGFSSARAAPNL
jgi:hypothetical protein